MHIICQLFLLCHLVNVEKTSVFATRVYYAKQRERQYYYAFKLRLNELVYINVSDSFVYLDVFDQNTDTSMSSFNKEEVTCQ